MLYIIVNNTYSRIRSIKVMKSKQFFKIITSLQVAVVAGLVGIEVLLATGIGSGSTHVIFPFLSGGIGLALVFMGFELARSFRELRRSESPTL